MSATLTTASLAQSLAITAWEELGFPSMIDDDYDVMDVANFIDTASDCHEVDTGISVSLPTILEARSILCAMSDAEVALREQLKTSLLPGAVQLNVNGVVSWYHLG